MKVIIMPLFQGVVVRNIIRTDLLNILLKDKNIKIIFLVKTEEKRAYLERDFFGPQIEYKVVSNYKEPLLNGLFTFLKYNLLKTKRMDIRRRILLEENKNYISFFLKYIFNRLFSHRWFRTIVRFFDLKIVKDTNYLDIFEEYKPDLVISAHPFGDEENSLIRQAKRLKIKTVAIINSWDKLTSRGILRILPDKMLVPNAIVKNEAVIHADMKVHSINITGMPYFDLFFNKKPRSKEWFYSKFNIDPSKKIVTICPTGQFYSDLDAELINRTMSLLEKKEIPDNAQIIVRFPPNDDVDTSKIKNKDKIIFYQPGIRFSSKRGVDWDMNDEDNQLLLDMLYWSSVIICPPSSISVDASVLDRPVINVRFGSNIKYSNNNIDLYYESDHYSNILGLEGIKLVHNDEELALWINKYMEDPSIDKEGRQKIVKEQCEYIDGGSARRMADLLLELANADDNKSKTKVSLICYHYIKRDDEFQRIWAHDFKLFKTHIDYLKENYPPISLEQLELALNNKLVLPPKCSIITFDDGLKEHVRVGEYLTQNKISAVFNVCGDVILKRKAVIVQTIHFGTAFFGVKKFAIMIEKYIQDESIKAKYRDLISNIEDRDIMTVHSSIKNFFNKNSEHYLILDTMRMFWKNELEKVTPGIFDRVFMDVEDLKYLISIGHSIGLHTASHISFKHSKEEDLFKKEIIDPKKSLEEILNYEIKCFAYPFGKEDDILESNQYYSKFREVGFDYIFTTYYDNIPSLRPQNLGRYLTQSGDSLEDLESNLWSYEISYNHK